NALTFPFSVGATVVLTATRSTPAVVKGILARHRPTLFCGAPTLYAVLLGEELPRRDRLPTCISAGEALPETLLHRWRDGVGLDILDGIGTTEMLHIFLSNRTGDIAPGTTGRAVPGYQVRVVDENGRETAADASAHLRV